MAFLRSVSRYNSLVLKKLPSSCLSGVEFGASAKFSRTELLASHRYYVELRRELNVRCNSTGVAAGGGTVGTHRKSASTSSAAQRKSDGSPKDALDLSFNNPEAAFKSKTTWELVRAYVVYLMCSSGYIVEHNLQVINTFYDFMFVDGYIIGDHNIIRPTELNKS